MLFWEWIGYLPIMPLLIVCEKMVTFHILGQPKFNFDRKHVNKLLCMILTLWASSLLRKGFQGFLAYMVCDENDLKLENISM